MAERTVERDHPVVLFDGVCNLCNGTVRFLLRRDRGGRLRFASLQSPPGESLLAECGYDANPLAGIVVVDAHGCHRKSDAILRIAAHLGWPYRLLTPTRWVPQTVRDRLYDFVATHRYGWFGTRDACMRPTADRGGRFLDDGMYPPPERGDG